MRDKEGFELVPKLKEIWAASHLLGRGLIFPSGEAGNFAESLNR